jgi:hypothetical protein
MSIFGKIRDAILGNHAEARTTPPPAVDTSAAPGRAAEPPAHVGARGTWGGVIDVENHLDSMPGADRLNWRTSIVDLMKLIGVPSDYESRQALAQELGRPEYSGSAEDNVWLHKRTMRELAQNGGTVPAEFLD